MAVVEQSEQREVRWGLPDVFIGLVVSWVAAVVVFLLVVVVTGLETGGETGTGSYVGRYGLGDSLDVERSDPALPLWTLPVGQAGLWAGLALAAVVAATWRGNGLRRDFGWSMRMRDVPVGLAFGLFAQTFVVWLIYAPFQQFFDFDVSEAARSITDRAATPGDIALVMLGVVVGAPIFEELFFRGFVMQGLTRHMTPVKAALLSSVLFALAHVRPVTYAPIFLIGLVLAFVFLKTRSLPLAMAAHAIYNAIVVAVTLSVGSSAWMGRL